MKELYKYTGVMEIASSSLKLFYPNGDKSPEKNTLGLLKKEVVRIQTNQHIKKLDLNVFEYTILPDIEKAFHRLKQKVHAIHIIATGYWRELENRHEIEVYIKQLTNQPVYFLSAQEEGSFTAQSFLHTYDGLGEIPDKNISIDLGGNSTEITLFNHNLLETVSLPIGTNLSLQDFYASKKENVAGKISEARDKWKYTLNQTLKYLPREISKNALGIATGSVIRKTVTGIAGKPSFSLHGCNMPLSELKKAANYCYEEAQKSILELDLEKNDNIRDLLFCAICLPVYIDILEHFHIEILTLNMAGVSYGYFFEKIKK